MIPQICWNARRDNTFTTKKCHWRVGLSDENGIVIQSRKPVVIVGQSVTFEAPVVDIQAPAGEVVMAQGQPGGFQASLMMSSRYDLLAMAHTQAESWNQVSYEPFDDEPHRGKFDWGGLILAGIGALVSAAVVTALSLTGIGAFVVGGLVAGAVTDALSAMRDAHESGLTGSEFLSTTFHGALVGGIKGTVYGSASYGLVSSGAALFGTTIAGLGLFKTMLCGGISGGLFNFGEQLLFTETVDLGQVFKNALSAAGLTGLSYGITHIRGFTHTDANGAHYTGVGNKVTGSGFIYGRNGGNIGVVGIKNGVPTVGVGYLSGRGFVISSPSGGGGTSPVPSGGNTSLVPPANSPTPFFNVPALTGSGNSLALPPVQSEGGSIFKEVNIHGKIKTEIDEVDIVNQIIYEDKSASRLYMDNPDFPQTEQQWAFKQIFKKGSNRIDAISQSNYTFSGNG